MRSESSPNMQRPSALRNWAHMGMVVLVLAALQGCELPMPTPEHVESNGAPASIASELKAGAPRHHALAIVGYNYTERYIDSFHVNGQGGGNLYVSGPTAGGGSSACCVSWRCPSR
jgi:hypothetical protein